MKATKRTIGLAALLACLLAPSAAAAGSGPAVDVAPQAPGTRIQQWPRAAWSEGAKSWLVAWREGDVTEEKSEIWCARVSADGKALDSRGVRLAGAGKLADRPSVASDGKDFLVVWEDLRNGKDWDVYAARVSGEGKALDQDGFVLAGGEHNQCRASAAFCKGSYLVSFLSFEGKGAPGRGRSGYVLRSMRISSDGRVLDAAPPALSDTKMGLKVWNPIAAAGGDGVLVAAYQQPYGPDYKEVSLSAGVAMPDGKVSALAGLAASGVGNNYVQLCLGSRQVHHPAGAAWTGRQFLVCVPSQGSSQGAGKAYRRKDCVVVCAVDAQGKGAGGPEFVVFAKERLNSAPCVSLAFDGERCLLTEDVIVGSGRGRDEKLSVQVLGCFLSPEGKPLNGAAPFAIFGGPGGKAVPRQGFAAAGPRGSFLAVCSEARGVDDVKVLARLVRAR